MNAIALVYVRHMPRYSLGEKSDEDLQCSPRSWLNNFMQPFSWRSSLSQALDFLNKLFLSGVHFLLWKITNFFMVFSSGKASPAAAAASGGANNHVKGEPLNCPLCHRECKHFHYLKGHISMHFRQKLKEKVTN